MAALLLLIAINFASGYQNRFSRSYHSKSQSRRIDEKALVSKVIAGRTTSLFSLGDPDTDMESNFYRWYVTLLSQQNFESKRKLITKAKEWLFILLVVE
jgi:hypothetical protein